MHFNKKVAALIFKWQNYINLKCILYFDCKKAKIYRFCQLQRFCNVRKCHKYYENCKLNLITNISARNVTRKTVKIINYYID